MKVIIDKSERLWKAPINLCGPMKFTQRRLQAREVNIIDLDSFMPEPPEKFLSAEGFEAMLKSPTSDVSSAAATCESIEKLKSNLLAYHRSLKATALSKDQELTITPGVRLTTVLLALSLLNRHEVGMYPEPGLPHFRTAICMAEGTPESYHLMDNNEYLPSPSLFSGLSKKVKLVFVNFPHNPTGAAPDIYFYRDVLKAVKLENTLIVADCAHVHPGDSEIATFLQLANAKKRVVELHSFSTTFGIDSLGFAAGHKNAIMILNSVISGAGITLDCRKIDLASAMMPYSTQIFENRMKILQGRRELLSNALKSLGWRVRSGRLLPFIWAKAPGLSRSVALSRRLFAKAGILTSPGLNFGETGDGWIRFSLCRELDTLKEAIERISHHSRIWQRKYKP